MRSFPEQARAFSVVPQRNAFGPRLVARAGDVWRAMQDVVVDQSASVGWTAERYVAEDRMFIVRTMTVVHHREVRVSESLLGYTWPSRARRDLLFTREVRLFSQHDQALLATATQEWALLSRALEPTRAGPDLYAAFQLTPGLPTTELPAFEPRAGGAVHHFTFRTWYLWMDPHAHVNHPAYVDYCDEGTNRLFARNGLDPQAASPVAEQVHFRGVIGPDVEVSVETMLIGRAGDAGVFRHQVRVEGRVCATATTFRRRAGADGAWVEALR
jgi:acyl-CoA thioesterase FadM